MNILNSEGVFDPEILEMYLNTTFQVRNEFGELTPFTVKNHQEVPFLKRKRFAVITAFNPMNEIKSASENERNNGALEAELVKRGFIYYPTVGVLGDHAEASFTVENILQEEAVILGRQFNQYAILYCDAIGPRFIRCH